MFVRHLKDCKEFTAGDDSVLRELLHPQKANLKTNYSLAQAVVSPGKITRPHKLRSTEVYYILEGEGLMHIDDESEKVSAGYVVYIPPQASQYIENTGNCDLKFLCIVNPAWQAEHEEVF